MTFLLKRCSRPEIAKNGNPGERLQRIGAKRSRGRSERAGTETETETEPEPGAEAGAEAAAGSEASRAEPKESLPLSQCCP
jgi:hypothetical protein